MGGTNQWWGVPNMGMIYYVITLTNSQCQRVFHVLLTNITQRESMCNIKQMQTCHWLRCSFITSLTWMYYTLYIHWLKGGHGRGRRYIVVRLWRQRHMGPHGEIKHLIRGGCAISQAKQHANVLNAAWTGSQASLLTLEESRKLLLQLSCDSHRVVRSDRLAWDSNIPGDRLWCPSFLTELCNF